MGRAPRTKETLPDFHEKCRVTRHSRVFCWLTGSQRTPGFWGVTLDTWHTVCHSKCTKCPAQRSFPRKTCKFRLSRNSTKIDVIARFRETIQAMKSISSSEIYKNFGFLPKLRFYHFSRKLDFIGVSQKLNILLGDHFN